jgi:hypothetical protein
LEIDALELPGSTETHRSAGADREITAPRARVAGGNIWDERAVQIDRAFDRVGIIGRGAQPKTPPMGLRVDLDSDALLFEEDRGRPRGLIGIDMDVSSSDVDYRHHSLQKNLVASV